MITVHHTKNISLLQDRNISECIRDGWRLLASNIFSLIKATWPVLVFCALWGLLGGLGTQVLNNIFGRILVVLLEVIVNLLILLQIVLVLRKYHQLDYVPSTKPWVLWKTETVPTLKSFWKAVKTIAHTPRQWDAFIAILFVTFLAYTLIKTILGLPFSLYIVCDDAFLKSLTLGDKSFLPSYLPFVASFMACIIFFLTCIAKWVMYLPLACFVGKLYANIEENNDDATTT